VAAANPVTRFVLERLAHPLPIATLQASLAKLAVAPQDGGRLEPFLLDLYLTTCSNCGRAASAEYFVWDRETNRPIQRAYTCPFCSHVAEEPATSADVERAGQFERHGLARARALEQVAPANDPDRASAEAALSVYPGRAIYALITVLNKLEQLEFEPAERTAAEAILLSTFDAANALWGYPEGRTRPRQLSASPRFREINVWYSLERSMEEWIWPDPGVHLGPWNPEIPPGPGQVAVFSGTARELLASLRGMPIEAVVTVLPRPNQAHWTLSALWTAWLWGLREADPIRAALRRRRYEWAWHASALRASLSGLAGVLPAGIPFLAFVPEAEPGFLAAAFAGLEASGFRLTGRALRVEEEQALLLWEVSQDSGTELEGDRWRSRLSDAALEALQAWGQPVRYITLHAASWSDLAGRRWLGKLWSESEERPLGRVVDEFETALNDRHRFVRLDARAEIEDGVFWLAHPPSGPLPLVDRVELVILELLRRSGSVVQSEVEEAVGAKFPGLLSPDRGLVQACLRSYALEAEQNSGSWSLREEDQAGARQLDREGLTHLVHALGSRLEYRGSGVDPVVWLDEKGREAYAFYIRETAAFGELVGGPAARRVVVLIPGGRGALVAEKARRDPRLELWLAQGARVVKYRHLRRLAEEETLKRENFADRLGIDPPGREDPQLPLL
jgi:hypothetical protein